MNAKITDKTSFLEGLFFLKQQITVETITTPPVTSGYCADASICKSAMTKNRLARRFTMPPNKLIAIDIGVFFGVSPFRGKKIAKTKADITALQSADKME